MKNKNFSLYKKLKMRLWDWILDSGASSHLCANKDAFHSYEPFTNSTQITIGDGSKIKAIRRGTIEIHLKPNLIYKQRQKTSNHCFAVSTI